MVSQKTAFILCVFILPFPTLSSKLEVQNDYDSSVAQKQLQQIYKQTKHMRYGKCWTKAVEELQTGCRQLTDETQRRIAYAFARCHLQSSGREIPECGKDQPMSECTNEKVLQDSAFITYTELFTHTQQICFHLQSQIWHEATEDTISNLADNSAAVASSLKDSTTMARKMVEQQNHSLRNQEELLRHERVLREKMQQSVLDVHKAHQETKTVIQEQRALFAEVFDRVSALQKTMLGEFTSIYTFGFYVGASILAYVLTSTPRSASARIWLFVLITLNFLTERAVVSYHLAPSTKEGSFYVDNAVLPETVYKDMWLCRKVYSFVALVLMIICIVRYKDYGRMNNSLLNEIKRQNIELQQLLKEQNNSLLSTPQKQQLPVVGASGDHVMLAIEHNNEKTEGIRNIAAGDESDVTNDVSTTTSYHSDDDSTFVGSDRSSESSFSNCITGDSFQSPGFGSVPGLIQSFVRSSTPSGGRSRRSSVSSSASFNEKLNESVADAEGVIIGGHNLRRRQRMNYNNLVKPESVESFIKSVAKVTARRKKILNS